MDHVVGFYDHFMLTLHGDVLSTRQGAWTSQFAPNIYAAMKELPILSCMWSSADFA